MAVPATGTPAGKAPDAGSRGSCGTNSAAVAFKSEAVSAKNAGNGKTDDLTKINDWLVEGMVDDDETLTCSPYALPPSEDCGFGPELALLLPGLMWLHRRRLQKA